ncbi:hypothetical protein ACEQPO_11410 [Bacillus sp. SL00103]
MIDTVSMTIRDAHSFQLHLISLKIAQFSDVHLSDTFPAKELESVVQRNQR